MGMPDYHEATIAAIATPPGAGGIGIIRLSGRNSLAILRQLFQPKSSFPRFTSHKLYYGSLVNPRTGAVVDEVLGVYMRGPHTYTREDVVEIHCHGSYLVLEEILRLVLAFPGTRLADPGEFTKRAFLNGRIDLTQAEAVADLLAAKTKEGASLAVSQLKGGLHTEIERVRDFLLALRAIIEVAIDFPEEDVEILDGVALRQRLAGEALEPLRRLLARADEGRILREGVAVVILGRPNVGKSSLLNCLLREERAIVTEIPGTTRDTIEEYLDIGGIPIRLVDTAGIREAAEAVEEIGIRRARQKLEEAELVLLVLDASAGVQEADRNLFAVTAGKKIVMVVNKIDQAEDGILDDCERFFPGVPLAATSAKTGEGIAALEEVLKAVLIGEAAGLHEAGRPAPNARHVAALSRAVAALLRVEEGLAQALAPDLLAIDLQEALDHLGDIVGETTTDDVLDMIFAKFCIGK